MDFITNRINAIGTQASPSALTTAYTGNTKTLDTGGADSIDLNLYFTPSATNSTLLMKVEFSDDGTYFFGEDIKSIATDKVTHSPSDGYHEWTPGVATLSQKNIQISNISCKYVKISFKYDTAGGTLWCQSIIREKIT